MLIQRLGLLLPDVFPSRRRVLSSLSALLIRVCGTDIRCWGCRHVQDEGLPCMARKGTSLSTHTRPPRSSFPFALFRIARRSEIHPLRVHRWKGVPDLDGHQNEPQDSC
jgi:hypothetical protein